MTASKRGSDGGKGQGGGSCAELAGDGSHAHGRSDSSGGVGHGGLVSSARWFRKAMN